MATHSALSLLRTPTRAAYALLAFCTCAFAALVLTALSPRQLGLDLASSADGMVVTRAPMGSGIPAGARVTALAGADGTAFVPRALDVIEEPDYLDTYEEMGEFFARQASLYAILASNSVRVAWLAPGGGTGETTLATRSRTLADLPFVFWYQLAVGFAALLIAASVYLVRPADWGARMYALTGVFFSFAAGAAAIYSTRELALPAELFRVLSAVNHLSSASFGMALVGLFTLYPKPLVRPRVLLWLPAVVLPWVTLDVMHLAPDVTWGIRVPLFVELALVVVLAVLQWRASHQEPLARAALLWFLLSTLTGCSLFLLTVVGASALGAGPALPQSYAFGFFLFMYVGIALGLRRYRLFDIDAWAYRILLWIAGAAAVFLLDVALVFAGVQEFLSLGAAVLIAGWLYFPLRQWLWRRIVGRFESSLEQLLPQLSDFAFIDGAPERDAHWDNILRRAFDPLQLQRVDNGYAQVNVQDDGLTLCLPSLGGLQGRQLRYAARGRRLFSSRDAALATTLCRLVGQILSGRASYDQITRAERQRLSRDLHDNLGARLLRLIHHLRGSPGAELAREAMREMRATVAALDAEPAPLLETLADWRAEAEARLSAAGVELAWEQPEEAPDRVVPPRVKATLGAVLREAVTNALKHAQPRRVAVGVQFEGARLHLTVENDGVAAAPAAWREGYGLRNMRARITGLGGAFALRGENESVRLSIAITLPGGLQ